MEEEKEEKEGEEEEEKALENDGQERRDRARMP